MGKWGFRIANGLVHGSFWFTCLLLIVFWKRIPDEIVTHFNGAGVADGWGGRGSLILILFVMAYVYVMHLICMRAIPHFATREKMYGKKLAAFLTEEDFAAGILMTMAYLAWTEASLLLMLDYVIICSAVSRPLGGWFVWVLFSVIGGELVWYFACYFKRKRTIKNRALMEISNREDEMEKVPDDM